MGVDEGILVFDDVSNYHVDGPDLVVIDTNIKCRFAIILFEEYWKAVAEVLIVIL